MASKRQKQTHSDPRAAIIDAALRLAGRRDWGQVTLAHIAREAKMPLARVAELFECREDIICAYGRRVDADVLRDFSAEGTERDRIFEIVMNRFERLNADRAAVTSILASLCGDPKQIIIALPHLTRSMAWMLEGCDIDTPGWKGALRVAGLTGVYAWCLRTWRDDETPDLSRTMAALDRALGRAESIANTIGL